jgi:hypothetical protein
MAEWHCLCKEPMQQGLQIIQRIYHPRIYIKKGNIVYVELSCLLQLSNYNTEVYRLIKLN